MSNVQAITKKEELTSITDTTLVDLLVVAKSLPLDEIEQLEAFTGNPFDAEQIAVQIHTSSGMKWTGRVIENGEPIFVAGYFQVGAGIWRSFMLPGDQAFSAKYAGETTRHVANVMEQMGDRDPFIRLETICLESRTLVRDWYPKIGLSYESTMPNYGAHGENAVMYTRLGNQNEDSSTNVIERI